MRGVGFERPEGRACRPVHHRRDGTPRRTACDADGHVRDPVRTHEHGARLPEAALWQTAPDVWPRDGSDAVEGGHRAPGHHVKLVRDGDIAHHHHGVPSPLSWSAVTFDQLNSVGVWARLCQKICRRHYGLWHICTRDHWRKKSSMCHVFNNDHHRKSNKL